MYIHIRTAYLYIKLVYYYYDSHPDWSLWLLWSAGFPKHCQPLIGRLSRILVKASLGSTVVARQKQRRWHLSLGSHSVNCTGAQRAAPEKAFIRELMIERDAKGAHQNGNKHKWQWLLFSMYSWQWEHLEIQPPRALFLWRVDWKWRLSPVCIG